MMMMMIVVFIVMVVDTMTYLKLLFVSEDNLKRNWRWFPWDQL